MINRYHVLKSFITYRTQLLEEMKNEFNRHTKEANNLQFRCEKLAVDLMKDRELLRELEEELSEYPTINRYPETTI